MNLAELDSTPTGMREACVHNWGPRPARVFCGTVFSGRASSWTSLETRCHQVILDGYGKLPYSQAMDKETTTARLEARLPADVYALLRRAAEMQGRTLTDFVVSAARDAAVKTIEIGEIIRLSVDDQRQIADALLNPPEPTAGLRRSFERRNRLLGRK